MFLDKSLRIALLLSALFHALTFLPLAHFKNLSVRKQTPAPRITYLVPEKIFSKRPSTENKPLELVKQAGEESRTVEPQVKTTMAPKGPDDLPKPKQDRPAESETAPLKPASRPTGIEIPPELPKEEEALYLTYYQSIREKIRAFVVKNYPHFIACGEVCLYFILSSDGRLKEVSIVEERSSPNSLLREIAENSLRNAAPFSPFPKDLKQGRLSFNVIVSFELED